MVTSDINEIFGIKLDIPMRELKTEDEIMSYLCFCVGYIKTAKNLDNMWIPMSTEWIPVETALPEVGSEVLVCYDFKGKRSVYIADFYGDGNFHGLDDEYLTTEGRKYRKAVAWMPLPLPYKEVEE